MTFPPDLRTTVLLPQTSRVCSDAEHTVSSVHPGAFRFLRHAVCHEKLLRAAPANGRWQCVVIVSATGTRCRYERIQSADERSQQTACQIEPVDRAIPAAAREPAGYDDVAETQSTGGWVRHRRSLGCCSLQTRCNVAATSPTFCLRRRTRSVPLLLQKAHR